MKSGIPDVKPIKTACMLCFQTCGLNAYVENGRLVAVEGMKEHPCSQGVVCHRGRNLPSYVHSPDRVLHPMIKAKSGAWGKVSWDEALDLVASKMQAIKAKHGARAVAFSVGSLGAEDIVISAFAQRLRGAFGTPNFFSIEAHCFRSRIMSRLFTFGTYPLEDPDNAECVILWGHNPDATEPPLGFRIRQGLDRGMRLIVIDPRKIPLANQGLYLNIKPGTDAALALAMLNVIVNEELYDKEFVEKYCSGFDKLIQHVQKYPPETAAAICDVPLADIYKTARIFARAKSASIIQGISSLDQYRNGFQTNRALAILHGITGNYDRAGAWCTNPLMRLTDLRIRVDEKPLGADEWPVFHSFWGMTAPYGQQMVLPDAILTGKPYPVKALITTGGNPAAAWPDSQKVKKAFGALDMMVISDLFMTETAQMADVFLPACSHAEMLTIAYNYGLVYGMPYVMLSKPLVERRGEAWPNWKIFSELGRKLGYEDLFPWNSDEEVMAMMLEPSKISVEELLDKPEGRWFGERCFDIEKPKQIRTPSQKIEIFSQTLLDAGKDPLPEYVPPVQDSESRPSLRTGYPLTLVPGTRVPFYTGWQHRNIPELRRLQPDAMAEIHPSTAAPLGIVSGSDIILATAKNKIKVKAHVTEDIKPGVVALIHGWEFDQNGNMLTDLSPNDPVTGYPELRALACRVEKIN